MAGTHASPPRGLDAARSPLFQGRFGRMFRNLQPASFGDTEDANNANLAALGRAMSANFDAPKDGPDAEESGIPALYTYFGQFIDHDISFDPVSTLTAMADPDGLTDFRNPGLNLDNLYGRGPGDQPYMYEPDGRHLRTGEKLTGGPEGATDLPRFGGRALIGDPRNDENSIVSQLQGLMIRFHNRVADDNPDIGFAGIQQIVRFHYQYVILNDFLPRIVNHHVLAALRIDGRFDRRALRFFHWHGDPFMPVEFSTAAYRLGHSMIRPGYRLNDADATLLPIFVVPGKTGPISLAGFRQMGEGRAIDWARFIDIETRAYGVAGAVGDARNARRLQFAYRLDTSIVDPLAHLPSSVAPDAPDSLGERNLKRGWLLGLPSGQSVARAMGVKELTDAEIMIAKAVDAADIDKTDLSLSIVEAVDKKGGNGAVFAGNCPLWTYILAEAAQCRVAVEIPVEGGRSVMTPQLGPVGGRIVAEVFLGLLFGDGASLLSLDPLWAPANADFKLRDLVRAALGEGEPVLYRRLARPVAAPSAGGFTRLPVLPVTGAIIVSETSVPAPEPAPEKVN